MEEQKLRQLFKNRSDCYADADDVIQAMTEDCFIETIKEAFCQPLVISSVCTCTKFRETPLINGKHICSICNKPIVQTDL